MRAAERRDRVRGGRRAGAQGQGRAGAGVARAARRRQRGGSGRSDVPGAAVRRSRRGAAAPQGPAPRDGARAAGPPRVDHRPGRHRQEPPRLGVREVHRRRRRDRSTGTAAGRPAYGEGITFWALGEMVRRRAGLAEGDDEATTRERISATRRRVRHRRDDERRWVEPALLTLLGLEPAPAGGRDVLFAAWRIFFERIAAQGTTVLVFEDLQWADSGLLDFIDHLLDWSKSVPLFVVTLARPELFDRRPELGRGSRATSTRWRSSRCRDAAMRELLAGLVPGLPEQAVRRILAPRRRHPALCGRDGPDAGRRRPAAARDGGLPTDRRPGRRWPSPRRCAR